MNTEIVWLIRLAAAHFLTDFVLQPDSWVKAKREKHQRAAEFWYHALLAAFFAVLFTGFKGWWWVGPVIFSSHFVLDWWKSYRKDTALIFLIDQLFHLAVIFLVWKVMFPGAVDTANVFESITGNNSFWIILLAVVFLTKPVGVIVSLATRQFREKIEKFSEQTLDRAGTWIGILERMIVFFLVLVGQWDAIGLLIAAKSILRLRDGDQKMSEYVLIGTLISIPMAVIVGFIVSNLI